MNFRTQAVRAARRKGSARSGFTLIELLTVIAIIAVLAAILFPVMATVRENVKKGSCSSQIHSIIQGAQMYQDDHRVWPDALLGVAYDAAGASFGYRLYPEYVKDVGAFTCPNHPHQLKGSTTFVQPTNPMTGAAAVDRFGRPLVFQARDSYDMQYRPNKNTGTATLNYNLKWSTGSAGLSDDPRQLVYKNAPDSTVVTWCLYHSNMNDAGVPAKGAMALVGFKTGRVQSIPAEKLVNWSTAGSYPWQVQPKP